eukprot:7216599-Pyramimonas_sp.AAC.1
MGTVVVWTVVWGHWECGGNSGAVEGTLVVGTVVRAVARTAVGQLDRGTVGTVVGTVGTVVGTVG